MAIRGIKKKSELNSIEFGSLFAMLLKYDTIYVKISYYKSGNMYIFGFKMGGIIMANYRPKVALISTVSAVNGGTVLKNLSTSTWGLVLVQGTALFSQSILASGAVDVWENTNTVTTKSADRHTFTNAAGQYGITCKSGVRILLKFYDN
ncbi:hypothetical protein CG709_17070 [Lachnotalea glycerini]|nr:hypothetical protein CG709_17070 [Lachnotalea glycerini]